MSKVSVVVPVYNSGIYLRECIESVLNQTYQNIELILVNDGSKDDSGIICQSYSSNNKVKYIYQQNQGVSVARQNGVDHSTGEWILFVDSDDTIPLDSIERMINISSDVDIIAGATDRDSRHKLLPDIIGPEEYIELLYSENFGPSPVCKLFKRTLFTNGTIRQFKQFASGEDLLMNLSIAVSNKKDVRICKESVYCYRMNESSATHSFRYTYDYCEQYFFAKEMIIKDLFSIDKTKALGIRQKIRFFYLALASSNYCVERENNFVRALLLDIRRFQSNDLIDRFALRCENPYLLRICYYVFRIRVRLTGRLHF